MKTKTRVKAGAATWGT